MSVVLLLAAVVMSVSATENNLCGEGELIPCLQLGLVRRAKELLDRDNIPLGGGLQLRRAPADQGVVVTPALSGTLGRQGAAVEEYAMEEVGHFLERRSVVWNLSEAVDFLVQLLPSDGTTEEGM